MVQEIYALRGGNKSEAFLCRNGGGAPVNTLDECIREYKAKPESSRHLYEVRTAPQPPLITEVLSGEQVVELARLRDFL